MKTRHVLYSLTVVLVGIVCVIGWTTDRFFHPPTVEKPIPKEQTEEKSASAARKKSAQQKKKDCRCCDHTMKKLKQLINESFQEKNSENKTPVVSQETPEK